MKNKSKKDLFESENDFSANMAVVIDYLMLIEGEIFLH